MSAETTDPTADARAQAFQDFRDLIGDRIATATTKNWLTDVRVLSELRAALDDVEGRTEVA